MFYCRFSCYHYKTTVSSALLQEEYEKLEQKIEEATEGTVPFECTGEYAAFANTDKRDHPSIIKVLLL